MREQLDKDAVEMNCAGAARTRRWRHEEGRRKAAPALRYMGEDEAGAVDNSCLATSTQAAACHDRETTRSNSTVGGELTSKLLPGLLFTN